MRGGRGTNCKGRAARPHVRTSVRPSVRQFVCPLGSRVGRINILLLYFFSRRCAAHKPLYVVVVYKQKSVHKKAQPKDSDAGSDVTSALAVANEKTTATTTIRRRTTPVDVLFVYLHKKILVTRAGSQEVTK